MIRFLIILALTKTCLGCPRGQTQSQKPDGSCEDCDRGCIFCEYREGSKICTLCNYGFFLDATMRCVDCVENCTKCIGLKMEHCFETLPGFFYDSPNKKIESCKVESCHGCSGVGTCYECDSGFILGKDPVSGAKKCFACEENCQKCSRKTDEITNVGFNSCEVCRHGFALVEGICKPCPLNCSRCKGETLICSTCEPGFAMNKALNQCTKVIENCYTSGEDGRCTICQEGYFLEENRCISCHEKVKNCSQCSQDLANFRCFGCRKGFFVTTKGDCKPCEADCERCDSVGCISCKEQHFVDKSDFQCKICTLPNCFICENNEKCSSCLLGFYVDPISRKCVDCPETCLYCKSKDDCRSCAIDHIPLSYYSQESDSYKLQCFKQCPETFQGKKVSYSSELNVCE